MKYEPHPLMNLCMCKKHNSMSHVIHHIIIACTKVKSKVTAICHNMSVVVSIRTFINDLRGFGRWSWSTLGWSVRPYWRGLGSFLTSSVVCRIHLLPRYSGFRFFGRSFRLRFWFWWQWSRCFNLFIAVCWNIISNQVNYFIIQRFRGRGEVASTVSASCVCVDVSCMMRQHLSVTLSTARNGVSMHSFNAIKCVS